MTDRRDGSPLELADALRTLGEAQRSIPGSDGGVAAYEEAAEILRNENAPLKLAHTVRHLGDIHRHAGNNEAAGHCYDEALRLYREHPEARELDVANALRGAALLAESTGSLGEALSLWEEARALYAKTNVEAGVAESSRRIARLR